MSKFQVIFLCIFLVIAGCAEEVSEKNSIDSFEQTYWVEDYAKDLNFPWAITWLPNGDLLVTERLGKIKLIRKGNIISELQGVPEVMVSSPFDGLLDIKIDPDFKLVLIFIYHSPKVLQLRELELYIEQKLKETN